MEGWVNINTNTAFAETKNQSPVIKCLMNFTDDSVLFSRLLSQGVAANLPATEKQALVAIRVEQVMAWRKDLESKFSERPDDRHFCLLALGHLIAARYSGKAQSFDAIGYTLTKLSNAIANNNPIVFTFCFGGYKCHTSPSHPEVDWAELFNLNFFISYLYPIIQGYSYGVEVEYESEEISIQFNNVPQPQTDRYTTSFKKLLAYYVAQAQTKYGLTLDMRLVIAREHYLNDEALYQLIEEKKPAYFELFDSLAEEEKEKWLQRAGSNFMWENGIKSYSHLTALEQREIIKNARLTNEAFLEADYILREDWFEQANRIPFVGTWGRMPSAQPFDGWLHLKSTAASVTDCWIGTGFLQEKLVNNEVEYVEKILSKSQRENLAEGSVVYGENTDDSLKQVSANFSRVPIIKV